MQVRAVGVNVKRKVHVSQLSPRFSQTLPHYTDQVSLRRTLQMNIMDSGHSQLLTSSCVLISSTTTRINALYNLKRPQYKVREESSQPLIQSVASSQS